MLFVPAFAKMDHQILCFSPPTKRLIEVEYRRVGKGRHSCNVFQDIKASVGSINGISLKDGVKE